ncbi:Vir family protein [Fusobacterium necrophorum]|uniref:Uncharacterized protein n=1 Tax=Fusobacterium necrophorum subsp. funduliforme TaxID=143387 RepID=A0A162J7Q0_9FUSO|nr:hypothetical protein [Fusobacterium necrophorum]KYL05289.1 hypothetical protein A2J07_00710 [Fusobacterium necrophorum subsp. funduliforme]MDK4523114.1 hypothetical protein [Fusobacterium necrophorum]
MKKPLITSKIEIIEEFPFSKKTEACNYTSLLNTIKEDNENYFVSSENKKIIVKKETIIYNNKKVKKKDLNRREWTELEYAQLVYLRQAGATFNAIAKAIRREPTLCSKHYEQLYAEDIPKYKKIFEENFDINQFNFIKKKDIIKNEKKAKFRKLCEFSEIEKIYLVGLKNHKIKSIFWNHLLNRKDADVLDFKQTLSKMSRRELDKYHQSFERMKRNSEFLQDTLIELSALHYGEWTIEELTQLVYMKWVRKMTFIEIGKILNRNHSTCQKKMSNMTPEQIEHFIKKGKEKYEK